MSEALQGRLVGLPRRDPASRLARDSAARSLRTPEGKATVAAFMDAYNNVVVSLRNYKAQNVKGGLGRGGQLQVGS
ncbi:hypothetical protein [Cupriavidus metallidurans]|uniref:hypothetical protein n=1 Tax=Cupriavidus metallidurans TaxID=119219 RepID=UPI001CC8F419|nr:hypothetical protein [Cupriavidus metallidurans]UBM12684.1 hypothetical protein LAI70_25680 [Cupriavidus metallidurans]